MPPSQASAWTRDPELNAAMQQLRTRVVPMNQLWERLRTSWWRVAKQIASSQEDQSSADEYLDWAAFIKNIWADNKEQLESALKALYGQQWRELRSRTDSASSRATSAAVKLGLVEFRHEEPWLWYLYWDAAAATTHHNLVKRFNTWWGKINEEERTRFLPELRMATLDRHGCDADLPPQTTKADFEKAMNRIRPETSLPVATKRAASVTLTEPAGPSLSKRRRISVESPEGARARAASVGAPDGSTMFVSSPLRWSVGPPIIPSSPLLPPQPQSQPQPQPEPAPQGGQADEEVEEEENDDQETRAVACLRQHCLDTINTFGGAEYARVLRRANLEVAVSLRTLLFGAEQILEGLDREDAE